jgi:hypothetical protein
MKKLFFLSALTLVCLTANSQDDKTLVKTLDPGSCTGVVMAFNYPTTGEEWQESTVRVLLDVKLTNGNSQVLQQLVKVGRYNIEGTIKDGKYVIDVPGLKKDVTVQGQKMVEEIKVTVYVPTNFALNNQAGQALEVESVLAKKLASNGLAAKGKPFFKPLDMQVKFTVTSENAATSADVMVGGVPLDELLKQASN